VKIVLFSYGIEILKLVFKPFLHMGSFVQRFGGRKKNRLRVFGGTANCEVVGKSYIRVLAHVQIIGGQLLSRDKVADGISQDASCKSTLAVRATLKNI
jgi:hypothetical protein